MLLLSFQIGEEKYAIKAGLVMEITPMVKMEHIPKTPDYIAGLFNYRGNPLPVIDLCQLYLGRPCKPQISTRVMIIQYIGTSYIPRLLGLVGENVTETIHTNEELIESGVSMDETPSLGKILNYDQGIIHYVETEKLLPDEVRAKLFN